MSRGAGRRAGVEAVAAAVVEGGGTGTAGPVPSAGAEGSLPECWGRGPVSSASEGGVGVGLGAGVFAGTPEGLEVAAMVEAASGETGGVGEAAAAGTAGTAVAGSSPERGAAASPEASEGDVWAVGGTLPARGTAVSHTEAGMLRDQIHNPALARTLSKASQKAGVAGRERIW